MGIQANTTVDYLILGGGIAGLTAARELLQRGYRVAILEKNLVVGGLARTLDYSGFRFDLGGHRFHSNNSQVVDWLHNLLGDELITVPRRSHIFLNNRYTRYPLQFPDALLAFGPAQAVGMVASYVWARCQHRNQVATTFEQWVVARFGRKIFTHFFEPYTEKVWGITCDKLSAEWAAQRIGLPSLTQALLQAVRPAKIPPATAINKFFYPRTGFGAIAEALARHIAQLDGMLLTNCWATHIQPSAAQHTVTLNSGQTIQAAHLISTIPLPSFLRLLPNGEQVANAAPAHYRGLITVFLALDQPKVSDDSWTYFPDRDLIFGRIHEPKNWSSAMVPSADVTSLCVEVFASPHEPIWQQSDEALVQKVAAQLQQLDLVKPNALINGWVQRLPHAYPSYQVDYAQSRQQLLAFTQQWPNVHLVGRTGSFRYMNTDGVIEDVFRLLSHWPCDDDATLTALSQPEGRWV